MWEGMLWWKSENILAALSFYSIVYCLFFHFNYSLFYLTCAIFKGVHIFERIEEVCSNRAVLLPKETRLASLA